MLSQKMINWGEKMSKHEKFKTEITVDTVFSSFLDIIFQYCFALGFVFAVL